MKKFISILTSAALTLSVTPVLTQAASNSDWTMCFYMCGTDLESSSSAATRDMVEMIQADIPDNVRIMLMTGGCAEWDPTGVAEQAVEDGLIEKDSYIKPDKDHTQIYEMTDDGMTLLKTYDENLNMGDAKTAEEFIKYSLDYAPADHTMVSFWDHGSGPFNGVAFDEYTNDSLLLNELSQVLEAANTVAKDKVDLVGFDACLMANIETAAALAPYADYMIASEELEPNYGWDYRWLSEIKKDSDAEDLGKYIVDSYAYSLNEEGSWKDSIGETLALIDLSRTADLLKAFDNMAFELSTAVKDDEKYSLISRKAEEVSSMYSGTGMLDMYSFLLNMKDILPSAQDVIDVLGTPAGFDRDNAVGYSTGENPAVVYRGVGSNFSDCIGLSFFYPTIDTSIGTANLEKAKKAVEMYRTFNVSDFYTSYLMNTLVSTSELRVFDGTMSVDFDEDKESYYMQIEDTDNFNSVKNVDSITVFNKKSETGEKSTYLLGSRDTDADWDKGLFYETTGENWYSINDQIFSIDSIESFDNYKTITVPVVIDDNDYTSTLTLINATPADLGIEESEGDSVEEVYILQSITDNMGGTAAPRSYLPAGEFTFSTLLYNFDTETMETGEYILNDKVTVEPFEDGGYTLYDIPIGTTKLMSGPNAMYNCYFNLTDMQGNTYLSEPSTYVIINDFASQLTIEKIPAQAYTGNAVEPKVHLTFLGEELFEEGKDYEISYENNVEVGTAKVTVTSLMSELQGSITAEFEIKNDSELGTVFNDVREMDWFYEAVKAMSEKGVINGMGNGYFMPSENIKRADFLIMAMRAYGIEPDSDVSDNFDDVSDGAYYSAYLAKAKKEGITTGIGDNKFAPENVITRQDMFVMIYRILEKLDKMPEQTVEKTEFKDEILIADYAVDAIYVLQGAGVLEGSNNLINPTAFALRSEASQIMYNLIG